MTRSTKLWITAVLALIVAAAAGYLAFRPSGALGRSASLTTDTLSRDLAEADRLPFLARYLRLHSEVEAAEFHIRYFDGERGLVPGPSEWDMRVAMKIAPANIAAWTADVAPTKTPDSTAWGYAPSDLTWVHEILPTAERWKTTSTPKIYTRNATTVIVFEPEGIVCKRVLAY